MENHDAEMAAMMGEYEGTIAKLNAEIHGLQVGLRESQPLQQRLDAQDKFVQRREKALSQARASVDKTQHEIEALQEKLQAQQSVADVAQAEVESARAEFKRIKADWASQLASESDQ